MLTLDNLKTILKQLGATEFLYKYLSDNDNSKNQIYLSGSYEALQLLPYGEIYSEEGTKRPTFKAPLELYWLSDTGETELAPNSKLILYPKYPEIRLSGFLSNCSIAPKKYLQPKERAERTKSYDGRVLILCVVNQRIIAYLAPPSSPISNYLFSRPVDGVFGHEPIDTVDAKIELLRILKHAYDTNPHRLVRMFPDGVIRPYSERNAAGYTLEAQFGIVPNGIPEPDFMDWELKCYNKNVLTLMTPQPNGGLYWEIGNRNFVKKYGHLTQDGSMYFTGPYTCESKPVYGVSRKMLITGFDVESKKITDANGAIHLVENGDTELASWSFSHILNHWKNKHNKVCYVKYQNHVSYDSSEGKINFLPKILLCQGTSPIKLLESISANIVYYDPGSKISSSGEQKARSQYRVHENMIPCLYDFSEHVDLGELSY